MTPKQQKFLEALLKDPTRNAMAAALAAGCPEASAKVTASRWKKLPEIQAALGEPVTEKKLTGKKLTGKKLTTPKKLTEKKLTEPKLTVLPGGKKSEPTHNGICQLIGIEEELAKERGGRPTRYTPELAEEICQKIASSDRGLTRLCRENVHFPAPSTIYRWLAQEKDFSEQYARAREAQADYLADQVIEIADDDSDDFIYLDCEDEDGMGGKKKTNHEAINRSRLKVEARKWKAAKLAPRKYGDKIDATIGGSDTPIQLFIQAVSNTTKSLIDEHVPEEDE